MSVDIYITPPPGLPDPREPISSMSRAPGNIMTAPEALGHNWSLDGIAPIQARKALQEIIAELDKGADGKFSDAWCVDADLRWSKGREMHRAWDDIYYIRERQEVPVWMRTREAYWGYLTRERLRKDAMRFFLYYYEVRWSP